MKKGFVCFVGNHSWSRRMKKGFRIVSMKPVWFCKIRKGFVLFPRNPLRFDGIDEGFVRNLVCGRMMKKDLHETLHVGGRRKEIVTEHFLKRNVYRHIYIFRYIQYVKKLFGHLSYPSYKLNFIVKKKYFLDFLGIIR